MAVIHYGRRYDDNYTSMMILWTGRSYDDNTWKADIYPGRRYNDDAWMMMLLTGRRYPTTPVRQSYIVAEDMMMRTTLL